MTARVVGVIDLRDGFAVHAVAGRRHRYRNVVADGIDDGDALALAKRYRNLGVRSLYVADLNAITGQGDSGDNAASLPLLVAYFDEVWIDRGGIAMQAEHPLADRVNVHFIVPTECFSSPQEWAIACEQHGVQSVTMGLDLAGNRLRSRASSPPLNDDLMSNAAPWLDTAKAIGITSVVLLDLASVGTLRGAEVAEACHTVAIHYPRLRLLSGGGVRDAEDVEIFIRAGCDRVLVGTALHRDESACQVVGLQ